MSWDDALVILESEFKNDPDEIESVDLLGGEPLTNFDLLKRIQVSQVNKYDVTT